ncbi:effector-associated domain EAD1-containing protein [Streptomyces sp. NBC_00035]|uniref:effector-associated domain EAD1-containing protein n=1 Tax=Streptomyces sp. NBC_00035 TaxID=2903614 RepID=UPI00386E1CCC
MATAGEMNQPARRPQAARQRAQDIPLSSADRGILLRAVASIYRDMDSARLLLDNIRFPASQLPGFSSPINFWNEVFFQLEQGVLPTPFRLVLETVLQTYGYRDDLRELAERYGLVAVEPEPESDGEDEDAPETCHVIVRAENEEEREGARRILMEAGQQPREVWSTPHAVSYQVAATEPGALRRQLERTDLGWTVVPPGRPDYLLNLLYVQGPDGRQWRITDAPAAQTVGNVAAQVVGEYGAGMDTSVPTVIDHEGPGGRRRRMNPDSTLDEEGVRDGDRMHVGFEATAGAANPLERQDALYRVRNQILDFAEQHTDFEVRVNSSTLPTTYELRFEHPSFGPPAGAGGGPVPVSRHAVLVQLGPDFPETAPYVFWETPIFHPNVFPNYECDLYRAHPESRGAVCLGAIAESYVPSLDFADVCQLLIDIAAYRNYGIEVEAGPIDARGEFATHANFFDPLAAMWARGDEGRQRIAEIGGSPEHRAMNGRLEYPNVIEAVDGP